MIIIFHFTSLSTQSLLEGHKSVGAVHVVELLTKLNRIPDIPHLLGIFFGDDVYMFIRPL
ncbi:hypothetical protein AU894_22860 [Salmonella enterica subsp. enterica]|uniref:Uncharacterized protein n=1 Tax=Salmonella enterica subsp. enterica serovar Java TaxID=224729 RepID=A0A3Y9C4U4_SALEB|nr:hypothetical protein [Salmonella enterica subsp. enterica serovar Java]